jgi:uncharacterized membrane protein YgcG
MAYSTTINGIGIGIDPYVAVSRGPSGQIAQFQSDAGTGASRTITVSLDKDATNFSVQIVGPSKSGNVIVGYNAAGQEIARAASSFVTPGTSTDTTYPLQITAPSGQAFRTIRLVPAEMDYVAYRNMVVSGIASTTVSNPTPTPIEVDLAKLIQVSLPEIDRLYVKDSFYPIEPQTFTLQNTSDLVDINVGLRGIAGVTFEPNILVVNRGEAKQVTVRFDVNTLNSLAEGLNTITAVCDLSSGTAIVPPAPPPIIIQDPQSPTPPTPTQEAATDIWTEERFGGAPMGVLGFFSLERILANGPYQTKTVQNINYPQGFLQAGNTIRWTGQFTFVDATYQFNATTDDGMRVWLDGNLIIDEWRIQGKKTFTRQLPMTAGLHSLRIEYFNGQGDSVAAFSYSRITGNRSVPSTGGTPVNPVSSGGGSGGGGGGGDTSRTRTDAL